MSVEVLCTVALGIAAIGFAFGVYGFAQGRAARALTRDAARDVALASLPPGAVLTHLSDEELAKLTATDQNAYRYGRAFAVRGEGGEVLGVLRWEVEPFPPGVWTHPGERSQGSDGRH